MRFGFFLLCIALNTFGTAGYRLPSVKLEYTHSYADKYFLTTQLHDYNTTVLAVAKLDVFLFFWPQKWISDANSLFLGFLILQTHQKTVDCFKNDGINKSGTTETKKAALLVIRVNKKENNNMKCL